MSKREKAGSDKHENRIQYKGEQSFVYLVGLAASLAESYQDFHIHGQLHNGFIGPKVPKSF